MILAAVRLTSLKESEVDFICSHFSEERQKIIRSYKHKNDADRTIIGETLARVLLSRILNITWSSFDIKESEFGKPYVDGAGYEFNISHSGNWVVCGVSAEKIGVDIEKIKPIDFNIAKYYFTQKEVTHLFNLCGESRLAYFYELWTLKESYLKEEGTGLYTALNSFSVQVQRPENIHTEGLERNIQFRIYNQFDHYKMAVCSSSDSFPDRVEVLEWDDLFVELL